MSNNAWHRQHYITLETEKSNKQSISHLVPDFPLFTPFLLLSLSSLPFSLNSSQKKIIKMLLFSLFPSMDLSSEVKHSKLEIGLESEEQLDSSWTTLLDIIMTVMCCYVMWCDVILLDWIEDEISAKVFIQFLQLWSWSGIERFYPISSDHGDRSRVDVISNEKILNLFYNYCDYYYFVKKSCVFYRCGFCLKIYKFRIQLVVGLIGVPIWKNYLLMWKFGQSNYNGTSNHDLNFH